MPKQPPVNPIVLPSPSLIVRVAIAVFLTVALLAYGAVHPLTQWGLHGVLLTVGALMVWRPPETREPAAPLMLVFLTVSVCVSLSLLPLPGRAGSVWPTDTVGALTVWALVGGFGLALIPWLHPLKTDQVVPRFAVGLAIVLGALAVVSSLSGTGTPKFIAPMINANHTATVAVWATPLVLSFQPSSVRSQRLRSAGLGAVVLTLGLCGSVGALMALTVMGLFWISRHQRPHFRWGALMVLGGATLVLAKTWSQRNAPEWEAQSLQMRLDIWADTVKMVAEHPFWGTGAGTFQRAYQSIGSQGLTTVSHAHSEPLQLWSELGVVGLVLAGIFLLWFLSRESRLGPAQTALWYAVLGMLTHGLVDFPLHIPAIAFLGVGSLVLLWPEGEQEARSGASHWGARLGLLLVVTQAPAGLWMLAEWRTQSIMAELRPDSSRDALESAKSSLGWWAWWRPESTIAEVWWTLRFGDRETARNLTFQMSRQFDNHPDALRQAASILLKTGDLSRGDEIGQQAIALAPRDYRNWAVASQISLARSEPKLATSRWAMAMRFWPRYVQISPIPHALRLNPIGLVWVDALRQAHPHWSHQLGDEMMKAGEHHTAILAYEQAQSLSSSQRDIPQLGLARVLVGEEEAGLAALQILVERYPSYPWVVRQQALAFEHLERYEEAAKGWAQAARTGQGDEAWRQCIQLLDLALLNAEEKKKKSLQRQQRRCQSRCHSCQ